MSRVTYVVHLSDGRVKPAKQVDFPKAKTRKQQQAAAEAHAATRPFTCPIERVTLVLAETDAPTGRKAKGKASAKTSPKGKKPVCQSKAYKAALKSRLDQGLCSFAAKVQAYEDVKAV